MENKITDLSFLQEFCKGDRTRMKKYIDMYLNAIPTHLDKINNTAKEKEYGLLSGSVHAMKAQLNYMGMKQTREVADRIERNAKEQNNLEELPQLISKLQYDCERSIEELNVFE